MPAPPAALAPYRVLDLTTEIGQYCGRAFAEMGADVIKVEPTGGDAVRRIGPFAGDLPGPERSLYWAVLNAGKKSITCDIEKEAGRVLFRHLLKRADLVLESYPPGYLASLGLDYDSLRAEHPSLVWVSITGFGQDGPYKEYRWSELVGLALGGLLYLWGDEDRPPVRARSPQAYYQASLGAAAGAMVALYHARRTGVGQRIDASMQEIVTFSLAGPGGITGFWPLEGRNITRSGPRLNIGDVRWRVFYECRDGHVATGGLFGPHTGRLVELMKRDDSAGLLADPRWLSATRNPPLSGQWRCSQEENDAAEEIFSEWLRRYSRDELLQIARENELLIFPVLTVAENLANDQMKHRGYFREVEQRRAGGRVTFPGPPVQLSATPWRVTGAVAAPGEHNEEIYGALALSADEQRTLRAQGVV